MALLDSVKSAIPDTGIGDRVESITGLAIVRGEAKATSAGWVRSDFGRALNSPQVIAVAEVRGTTTVERNITKLSNINLPAMPKLPKISIPSLPSIPDVNFRPLDRISEPDFANDIATKFKQVMGDWNVFNAVRDLMIWPVSQTVGFGLHVLWIFAIQPQIDRVQDWTDGIRGELNGKINNVKNAITSNVQSVITNVDIKVESLTGKLYNDVASTIGSMDAKVTQRTTELETRANKTIHDLYAMWGIPEGYAITPIHIKDVTSTGFTWLSLGETTLHFIAIGGK